LVNKQYFKSKIFTISNKAEFEDLALQLFNYQAQYNEVYNAYLNALSVTPSSVVSIRDIPFLPISLFKSHEVKTGHFAPAEVFTSSGTTGNSVSRHFIEDVSLYHRACSNAFERAYGPVKDYCVLALLPSYLDRDGSSLIYMAQRMIEKSTDTDSGFYLNNLAELFNLLQKKINEGKKTLLLGVSFALLDFVESYQLPANNNLVVMETGGMKGRRKEMIRAELHALLTPGFGVPLIHSEYGMTELMSQAYSKGQGRFHPPPWVQIWVRQTDDPFSYAIEGKTGGINIIDLANVDSCAFLETQDLGRIYPDASFEVMGRFDNADIRGCNLMVI
jgi:phenylacetate-coenzyme A ligase PaaK-like adenylate-forming protein